ncbi:MAG TPA: DUF3618 domain-containing protein [Baekduia sp.]|nr:DUF3618 domain-containing protein [Baekduia sp.]
MIRKDIEDTRERMGDTVDALGYKADVKSRTQEAVSDKVSAAKDRIGGVAQTAQDKVGGVAEATPSTGDVKHTARRAGGMAQDNPLGLAIGSVAVGFLAGLLIPSTSVEQEHMGPIATDVKDKVMETGQEALEHGKQVVQETAQTAAQTAQEKGQEHAQELKDSAQQTAQEVGSR